MILNKGNFKLLNVRLELMWNWKRKKLGNNEKKNFCLILCCSFCIICILEEVYYLKKLKLILDLYL